MIIAGIMAAGLSSRFGKLKQIEMFNGKPLAQHAIDAVKPLNIPFYTVLGHECMKVKEQLDCEQFLVNPLHKQGLGNTISFFANYVLENFPEVKYVIIHLADLPLVRTADLRKLLANTGETPVACQFSGGFGPPCIFPKKYLPLLANLNGCSGAKSLLKHAKLIDIDNAAKDIDYRSDFINPSEQI